MRKELNKLLKGGLFMTVGGFNVELPFDPRWPGLKTLFLDVTKLVNFLVIFSSVIAVTMMIVSGYTLITAAGDPDKIEQGQKTLTAAVVGLVVVFIASLIVRFVLEIMNYG